MEIIEIVLDTETTGLDPYQGHKIIEIGCVKLVDKIRTNETFHFYLHPEREVPDEAYKIHGISTEFLKDKPLFKHIVDDFLGFIGNSTLVIHNAVFDLKFLNYELLNVGYKAINNNIVDTLQISRSKFPGRKANLDALCKHFKIDLSSRTKHGALLDAELLAEVYIYLTGGKQGALNVTSNDKNTLFVNQPKKLFKEPRVFELDNLEIDQHNAIINKIKNPIFKFEEIQ